MKKITVMAFLLALLAPMMSVWAGGGGSTTTYNYSATVSVTASGNGTVYIGQSETANDKTKKTDSQSESGSEATSRTFTFWAFAEPDPGYEFGGWSEGADSIGSATSKVTVSLSSSTTSKDVKLTATFNKVLTFDGDEYIIDENGGDLATLLGTVKEGDKIIINKDVEIAKGVALTIPAGVQVSVSSGKTLTVKGDLTIHADARLVGDGTLAHNWKTVTQAAKVNIPFPLGTDGVAGTGAGVNTVDGTAGKYLVTSVKEENNVSGSFTCKEEFFVAVENKASGETYYSKPSTSKPVGVLCTVAREKALNWIEGVSETVYTDCATLLTASATSAATKTHEVKDTNKLSVLLAAAGTVTYDGTSTSSSGALGFAVDLASTSMTLTTGKQWNSLKLVRFFNGSVTVKKKVMNTNFCVYNCSGTFDYLSGGDYYTAISFYDSQNVKVTWDDLKTTTPAGGQNYYGGGPYNATNAKFQATPTTKFNAVYWGTFAKGMAKDLATFKGYLYNTNEVDAEQDSSQNYVVKAKVVDPNVGQVLLNGEESTFANAIANAPANAKIVLQRDVEIPSDLTLTVTGVQIDLGGFKLTGSNAIINNGDLEIIDVNGNGQIDVPVINNGTLLLSSAKYNGPITLNSGFCYFLAGTFNGGITVASSVEDAKSVAEVCGGTYATLTYAHGGQNEALVDLCESGYVKDNAIAPIPVSNVTNPSFAAYSLSAFDSTTKSLYTRNAARSGYTREEWITLCKLKAASALFSGFGVDCAVTFDRAIAANDVSVTAMGIYPFDIDEAIAANKSFSALFQAMRRSGMATAPWTYGTILPGGEHDGNLSFRLSNKFAQDGTLCLVEMRLATGIRNMSGPKDWSYTEYVTTATRKLVLGNTSGDKAMIRPETGAATFYATLGVAMDAAANGGTVMLANDCTTALPLNKAGTYTFDTMGFAASDEVMVADGLFVKSATVDDSSAKDLVADAKATTYVVAQKVAGVGAKFYDNLVDVVGAANGAAVALYAATEETITLTAEGQSFTLNKNGIAFDDAKVVTSVEGCSVKAEETQVGTLYTVVQNAVEDANGNSYATIGEAIAQTASDTVEVTVTAPVVQEVEVPQGKTVTVTIPENVAATVTVQPAAGSFLVTTENNNKTTTYEAKQITEVADEITATTAANIKVEEVSAAGETNAIETVATIVETVNALMNNKALERADNTAKTDVLKEITVVPSAIVRVVDNNDKAVVRSAAFDVTPKDANGDKVTTDDAFTFRLPIDADIEVGIKTIVRHEGAFFGLAAIQAWSNYKFIEVTSSNFSEYSYEILDGETANPVAAIGTTGYATLAGAIAGAQSGDTVQLLADITGVTTTYNIDKVITIDGQGLFKIAAGENAEPRPVVSAWGGPRVMFDLTRSTANVSFKNVTLDNGEGHYYSYFVRVKSGTATFEDVVLLRGAEKDSSGTDGAGYGAAILADGGNVVVQGDFYADTHGEPLEAGEAGDRTAGIFPFTAILHQNGVIYFHDGVNANIGQDLLLVGKQNEEGLDASDEAAKAQIQVMLTAMNVPAGYVPYTLNLADSAQLSFIGASPLGWNSIINYGKDIMTTASDAYGMELDTATTPVEVGLLDDTVLTEPFTYEDSNFTINGNGNTLSGTIEYTDNAGTMENVVMGTEEAPLVLDMTGLGEGKSINLGTGIAAENVTIKVTEEQATTQGQTIVTWNTEGETIEESAAMENGIKVAIVDGAGEPIVDEETGEPQEASLVWDAEVGRAYIGPCEARLTTVDANNETAYIYTSLACAIELARNSDDTVTLMMDIENFTGTQEIYKSLVLDGAGHKIAAKPVTTHRNTFSTIFDGTAMLKINGLVTIRNITIDGDASHAYTYLVSADNSNAALTTENVVLLHGGELAGDENGAVLEKGAGYGAAIHLNNGASIIVKDGFYADTHGAPAEPGQTIEKSDGVFPFTGILPEGNSSVEFRLTADADAAPTVAIGEDLLLVGMVGAIDSETAQGILDYMKVPSRFRPYTLTLGDGSMYAFTGASLLGWNEIIDYGKDIMDVSKQLVDVGLDKETTPVEVGLLTDTELPDTFTYADANFTVNGNGNALSGTIKYTDEAGIIENIVLGTEEKPLVLDLREVTDPVEIGNLIAVDNVTVLMTAEQATLGQPVFTWNVETADEPDNAESVKITVLPDATSVPTGEEKTKGLVWDDELGIAYIGPCEARLTGPEREPAYMNLADAFSMAADGDTITIFWAGVALNQQITLGAGTLTLTKGKYNLVIGENGGFLINDLATVLKSDLDLVDCIALGNEDWLLSAKTSDGLNTYRAVARGTYNVAVEDANGVETTAPIMVPDEWVAANAADAKTLEEIEDVLETFDSTLNMKRWQAYVMNQTTQFKATSFDHASGAVTVAVGTPKDAATTGFEVSYSLDEVTPRDVTVESGMRQSSPAGLAVAVTSVETHAFFKVRIHFTSTGAGREFAHASMADTIGVLAVDGLPEEAIVAVPWADVATGGALTIDKLVDPSTLASGDEILAYDTATGKFMAWRLAVEGSVKSWQPVTTVAKDGCAEAEEAAAYPVARGGGVWLLRGAESKANKVYLAGSAVQDKATVALAAGTAASPSWTLVGTTATGETAIADFAQSGDRVVVPLAATPRNYTFKNGAWGYSATEPVMKNGVQVGVRPVHKTDEATIKPGCGFWYLNTSGAKELSL